MKVTSVEGVGLAFVWDGVGRGLDVHVFVRDIWQGSASAFPPRVLEGESMQKL